jgi:hypothetical protein
MCVSFIRLFGHAHPKMGRWRGGTFKEYVHEKLHCFLGGMAKDMKQCFHFVNVTGHAFHVIPLDTLSSVLFQQTTNVQTRAPESHQG